MSFDLTIDSGKIKKEFRQGRYLRVKKCKIGIETQI